MGLSEQSAGRSYDIRVSPKTTVHYELTDNGEILSRTTFDTEGRVTTLLVRTDAGDYQERIFSPKED